MLHLPAGNHVGLGQHFHGQGLTEGGAAAMAYSRLQFEDLDNENRQRIKNSLLRYCELDTLAMIMVLQAWKSF